MSAPTTVQWLRDACVRVSTGSGRLAANYAARLLAFGRRRYETIAAWVNRSSGIWWLAKLALLFFLAGRLRLILFAVAERVYARVESGAWGWLLWTAAALWLVGAYRAGADDWKPKQPVPDAGQELADGEEQPEPTAEQRPRPLPVSPVALVAAVRDVGTPHAQLKPLAEHLGTTTDAVRATAAEMGWAVKDVRMQGRSASAGLRLDEVPSPEQVYPDPDVVGAGQAADDNDDDSGEEGPREGISVRRTDTGQIVFDLAEQHRITATDLHKRRPPATLEERAG